MQLDSSRRLRWAAMVVLALSSWSGRLVDSVFSTRGCAGRLLGATPEASLVLPGVRWRIRWIRPSGPRILIPLPLASASGVPRRVPRIRALGR